MLKGNLCNIKEGYELLILGELLEVCKQAALGKRR